MEQRRLKNYMGSNDVLRAQMIDTAPVEAGEKACEQKTLCDLLCLAIPTSPEEAAIFLLDSFSSPLHNSPHCLSSINTS